MGDLSLPQEGDHTNVPEQNTRGDFGVVFTVYTSCRTDVPRRCILSVARGYVGRLRAEMGMNDSRPIQLYSQSSDVSGTIYYFLIAKCPSSILPRLHDDSGTFGLPSIIGISCSLALACPQTMSSQPLPTDCNEHGRQHLPKRVPSSYCHISPFRVKTTRCVPGN